MNLIPVSHHNQEHSEHRSSETEDNKVTERQHGDSNVAEQDGHSDGSVARDQAEPRQSPVTGGALLLVLASSSMVPFDFCRPRAKNDDPEAGAEHCHFSCAHLPVLDDVAGAEVECV